MTPTEQALLRHQLAQSQMFRELIALNHRAEETETTPGRLVQRSVEADAQLRHEVDAGKAIERNAVGLRIGTMLPGSTDNGGPGVPVEGVPICQRCGQPKKPDSIGHRHTGHLCFHCGYSTDNPTGATP